jgi:N-methylhydantoinase B
LNQIGLDFDPITLEVLWNRLISIVDESAAAMVRTAFSTIVRESNDFSCVLFDSKGRSLAQNSATLPSFTGTVPRTMKDFLKVVPIDKWHPGDAIVTNDPWLGTGHLFDLSIARPIFYKGRRIGFSATVAHLPDIGGRARAPDTRDPFEEGLRIPVGYLIEKGVWNKGLIDIIRANVRVPDEVMGDIEAHVASHEVMNMRLIELLEEEGFDSLDGLAAKIQGISEKTMKDRIRELLPDGKYSYEHFTDGYDEPVVIRLNILVDDEHITIDYDGTSNQVDYAINVPFNYTYAYSAFAIKCLLCPDLANNDGFFRPVKVCAPAGSILNPSFPAAVSARMIVGHNVASAIFAALAEPLKGHVRAPSAEPAWATQLTGTWKDERRFASLFFFNGGMGAAASTDGAACLAFPSNARNTPVEIIETVAPIHVLWKRIRQDSGGPGLYRGGCGQSIGMKIISDKPVVQSFLADKTKFPALGLFGGHAGGRGRVLIDGEEVNPKQQRRLDPGAVIQLDLPGGGGFGPPEQRDWNSVRHDVLEGDVSIEAARETYKVDMEEG